MDDLDPRPASLTASPGARAGSSFPPTPARRLPSPGRAGGGQARLHTQPLLIVLVAMGGMAGTAARYGIGAALPTPSDGWPTTTFVVNVVGAFILGALLEALARSGPDSGWRRRWRLLLGTGFCGAFTTYSSLAVQTDLLLRHNALALALAYGVTSVVGGFVATTVGIAVAAGRVPRREHPKGAS